MPRPDRKGTRPRRHSRKSDRGKRSADSRIWLFGLHAVKDALLNPRRKKYRLILSQNSANRLASAIGNAGVTPEIVHPKKFRIPISPDSVHQGAALLTRPLNWGSIREHCAVKSSRQGVVLLDRLTDPHNVGAILRSAEFFGITAAIAPYRHSAPESGALAKSASGALERLPYLRVRNLAEAMQELRVLGYFLVGLDSSGEFPLEDAFREYSATPVGLVLGSEGKGLRARTIQLCDCTARIRTASTNVALNVSNAAAVAFYGLGCSVASPQELPAAETQARPRKKSFPSPSGS